MTHQRTPAFRDIALPNADVKLTAGYGHGQVFEEWLARDPVERFALRLQELGFATQDETDALKAEVRQLAIDARKKVLADPMPDGRNIEEGVYAD